MSDVKEYNQIVELDEMFQAMLQSDEDWMESAKESVSFYTGSFGTGQWTSDDLEKLRSENRPPLQLNIVLPKVNLIAGVERQQRSYWRAKPVEATDEQTASLITPLLLHMDRGERMQSAFSRAFKDGVITGRGWLDVFVDVSEDFEAEIFVNRESWSNVFSDPEAREPDTKQWSMMARTRWLTLPQLKSLFPDALSDLKDVDGITSLPDLDFADDNESTSYEMGSKYAKGDVVRADLYIGADRRRVRVVDMFKREYDREHFIVVGETGRILPTSFKSERQADEEIRKMIPIIKKQSKASGVAIPMDFKTISKSVSNVYSCTYSGARLLSEKQLLPYNHKEFPLVPFYYYFEDMGEGIETFGVVENLKDPQREKDKRRSQALDILNRTPKGGGVVDGSSGLTAEDMNRASSAGEWVKTKKKVNVRDVMQQWSMAHLPILNVVSALEQQSEIDAKEISGATDPLMGIASSSKESGFASQVRMKQGMLTLTEAMNNLDNTKRKVLEMVVSNMQQFWSEEKIRRIIGEETEEADEGMVSGFINEFKNRKSLKYDILIDKGDNSPTVKAMKFREISQLLQMIPQYSQALLPALVENSDWESKEEILEKIQAVGMQQALLEAQKAGGGK